MAKFMKRREVMLKRLALIARVKKSVIQRYSEQ